MKRCFAIATVFILSLTFVGNILHINASFSFLDAIGDGNIELSTTNETSSKDLNSKTHFNSNDISQIFQIYDLEIEEEEEEEEGKKKLLPTTNWERNAALLNANLSLSSVANNYYSSPKNNSTIERGSLRTHLRYRVLII